MKIIFLCSGNTCRSPMAEGIFKKMLEVGKNDVIFDISSAGFSTYSGEEIEEKAIIVCRKHNIDISKYKTTNIKDIDFNTVDLALTATVDNREKIKKFYPNLNAYTIREYSGLYEEREEFRRGLNLRGGVFRYRGSALRGICIRAFHETREP